MNIVLLYPTESRKETKKDVVEFDTAFGSENTVYLKYENGESEQITATGLTIVGGQLQPGDED